MATLKDRPIKLVVFDCDGTLVDSQHVIAAAMGEAFLAHGLRKPAVAAVRAVVGLSLAQAVSGLMPGAPAAMRATLVERYKLAFHAARERADFTEPLFPGVRDGLATLEAAGLVLAIATGKSRRGLDAVLAHHGLADHFVSLQTADRHPSKPHPAMLQQAMAETGVRPEETVLVGDTTFDMEMARHAGARPIGVGWGYHPASALRAAGAAVVVGDFAKLLAHLGLTRGAAA